MDFYFIDKPNINKMITESNLPGSILETMRYNRGDLEKGVEYIQVTKTERKHVGRFVGTYRQGSGDGMKIILKFEFGGGITTIEEDMWGSVNGDELSYFEKA